MKPAPYDESVIYAARALSEGIASEGQQKRFMEWLCFVACHVRDVSFDPTNERLTAFREGERHIGLQVGALILEDAVETMHRMRAEASAQRARGTVVKRSKSKTVREAKTDG